ncbi:thylakoid lumenal 17.9 kDa protein, chloroplastic isoform X4 [Cryptomeria japonica]|uniref:thylakoid lumenal 17.9 kDa protein, chloroplastic isoform X4 n=1 Tax=Cryptomeria japonica TaxID=3369 RepID=UPI0025AC8999|nr:thylakoid lumenal 17.9 kDa protein, chloroplastic isoform X4 [Cryptomeria japonica]
MSASTLTYRSFLPINSLKRGGCVYCRQRLRENNAVGGALLSVGISIALLAPLPALPLPSNPTTPFSESQSLQLGLENGRIRSCPSSNPNCISTTSRSASFAMPWGIPEDYPDNAVQKIEDAILKTQRNPKIQKKEATPSGQYLQAEVDGVFGRDVLEFLVKSDLVTYRSMAKKVVYVYPFTTAFGNSKGQEERMEKIVEELGWYVPSYESMY